MFKAKLAEQNAKQEYAKLQTQLKGLFAKISEKSLQYSVGDRNYKVTNVDPTKIIWDVEKLQKQLKSHDVDAEIVKTVIESEYTVIDWNKFVSVLSEHGIKAKEVLPCIQVDKTVNQKKIDEMSELGYITPEDIDGCYTVEKTNGYCKLTEWENQKEDDE